MTARTFSTWIVVAGISLAAFADSAAAQDTFAPPAPQPATPAPPTAGQRENGLVLAVQMGTRLIDLGTTATLDTLDGGFFAGLKLGKLMVGLGIGFSRAHSSMGGGRPDTSLTPVVLMPGVRYTFLQSDDQRVELFGDLDLGIGHAFGEPNDANNVILRYVVGPGLRYWVHPQFAVEAVTGLNGDFVWTNGPWSMNDIHSVFAALRLVGVF